MVSLSDSESNPARYHSGPLTVANRPRLLRAGLGSIGSSRGMFAGLRDEACTIPHSLSYRCPRRASHLAGPRVLVPFNAFWWPSLHSALSGLFEPNASRMMRVTRPRSCANHLVHGLYFAQRGFQRPSGHRVELRVARRGGLRDTVTGPGNFIGPAMYLRGIPCNKGGGRSSPVDGYGCVSTTRAASYIPLVKQN